MIWVVTSVRRPFVGSLLKSELQNLFSDVVFMSENECMQMLKELLMNDGSDTTTVVADIYCTVFISFIIDVGG